MTEEGEVSKFMRDTMEHRGATNERLKSIETMLAQMDKKLSRVVDRMSMAQGGAVALMAVVGAIASGVGLLIGLYKIIFQKTGVG